MKILALIPARGGSKRLKNKNILDIGGKPLIHWTIEQALDVKNIFDVIVSTDSNKIAEVSRLAGASVPWLRPKKFASDSTSSVEVAIHALDWFESRICKIDGLLLLQPTSPFRTKESINKAIDMFKLYKRRPIVSVSPGFANLDKVYFYKNSKMLPVGNLMDIPSNARRSNNFYTVNGAIYLVSPSQLRSEKTFISSNSIPLKVNSPIESLDIDSELDFKLALLMSEFIGRS